MSQEKRKLSHTAYGGIKGDDYFHLYQLVKQCQNPQQYSLIIGMLFAMIFAAVNTYLRT